MPLRLRVFGMRDIPAHYGEVLRHAQSTLRYAARYQATFYHQISKKSDLREVRGVAAL